MSDFLTNLAARSFGRSFSPVDDVPSGLANDRATVIRPRRTLPFEQADRAIDAGMAQMLPDVGLPLSSADFASHVNVWPRKNESSLESAIEESTIDEPARNVEKRPTQPNSKVGASGNQRIENAIGQQLEGVIQRNSVKPAKAGDVRRSAMPAQSRTQTLSTILPEGMIAEWPVGKPLRGMQDIVERNSTLQSRNKFEAVLDPNISLARGVIAATVAMNPEVNKAPNNSMRSTVEKNGRFNGEAILTRHSPPGDRFEHSQKDQSPAAPDNFTEDSQAQARSITRSSVIDVVETIDGAPMVHQQQLNSVLTRMQIAQTIAHAASHVVKQTEVAKSEPIIEVRIGRIEVRATPTPSSVKSEKTRKGPAVMTLDDYLEQRSKMGSGGGGR